MLYSYIVLCISLIFSLSEPLYIWKWMQAWSPCSDIYLLNGIKSGSCSGYPWDNNATPEQDQGTLCVIVSTVISLILMRCIACGLRSARLRHMSGYPLSRITYFAMWSFSALLSPHLACDLVLSSYLAARPLPILNLLPHHQSRLRLWILVVGLLWLVRNPNARPPPYIVEVMF